VRLSGRLATDWMYAWTRNPMLLCTLAWFACLGIWHQSTWFLALLAVSVTPGWIFFVRVYEERELELRFGRSYLEYRQRVPFLWPRVPGIAARGVVSVHPPPT
jgi:protein-S-isoprenylcysteine O-methyltransferase Ste14